MNSRATPHNSRGAEPKLYKVLTKTPTSRLENTRLQKSKIPAIQMVFAASAQNAVAKFGIPGAPQQTHKNTAQSRQTYAAAAAMMDALCPPNPKLLLITARNFRSRGLFGV